MSQSVKSKLTRRRFCRAAAAIGSLGALGRFGALAQTLPALIDTTGPGSLRSHAAVQGLLYGAAVNPVLLDVDGAAAGKSVDPYTLLFAAQANILVAENSMKWGALRPAPDKFDFTQGDRLVRFAGIEGQRVRGHNLCWHESNPGWLKTTANKDNARQFLTEHIQTVAGHFRGKLHSWDVVNEAINPSDGLPDGLRKTLWLDLIGPDYLELAFRTAAAADPRSLESLDATQSRVLSGPSNSLYAVSSDRVTSGCASRGSVASASTRARQEVAIGCGRTI